MKRILIIIFLLSTQICFASKVFYDPITKKEIFDVSGDKSKNDVIKEYQMSEQTNDIILGENEHYRIVNNQLTKYDFLKENKDIIKVQKQSKKSEIDRVKQKLNLTDEDIKALKEALSE